MRYHVAVVRKQAGYLVVDADHIAEVVDLAMCKDESEIVYNFDPEYTYTAIYEV